MAVGAKGPRAAKSALRLRALSEFPWLKVPIHNLAHNLSHNPVHDPARNPAKGGCSRIAGIMWRGLCNGSRMAVAM